MNKPAKKSACPKSIAKQIRKHYGIILTDLSEVIDECLVYVPTNLSVIR